MMMMMIIIPLNSVYGANVSKANQTSVKANITVKPGQAFPSLTN